MNGELVAELSISMMIVCIFALMLCVFGCIFEHVIPGKIADRIVEAVLGKLSDDFEE